MAKEFTTANFQQEVLESKAPVLVDFWAEWCGPCRMIAPLIDELHDDFKGKHIEIPHDGEIKTGTIIGRKRNADGVLIGTSNENPVDDHSVYEV